jgi:hypothetical protein
VRPPPIGLPRAGCGRVVLFDGTEVYFTNTGSTSTVAGEQFWGRAVQASRNSKEFGALFIVVLDTVAGLAARIKKSFRNNPSIRSLILFHRGLGVRPHDISKASR